jgi:pseudouridine synthase
VLSRAGLASRSEAARWIRAGRVEVNGALALDPETWVDPACDAIRVDGAPLVAAPSRWIALHKPVGFVTTASDERGRPTVYDLLGDVGGWLAPVGRLDRDTSGLLLLTNESALADRLLDPARAVEKLYRVVARPSLGPEALERLARGPVLEDGPTRPARVRPVGGDARASVLELAIVEGKNRQVRRMLEAVGSRVERLERLAIGPLRLGDLPAGRWRALEPAEVDALARAAGAYRSGGSGPSRSAGSSTTR